VRLPLEVLRQLSLESAARRELLQELLASGQSGDAALALQVELADTVMVSCQEALERADWRQAIRQLDELVELVSRLAAQAPQQAPLYWRSYGQMLAALTAAIHPVLTRAEAEAGAEQADLQWLLAQRLCLAHQLPFEPPHWLAVHERQILQKGGMLHFNLREAPPEGVGPNEYRTRAAQMLLRLHRLIDPPPPWVLKLVTVVLGEQAELLLSAPQLDAQATAGLIADLAQLPVDGSSQVAAQAALVRARASLELLAPELQPLSQPATAQAEQQSDPPPAQQPDQPSDQQPDQGAAQPAAPSAQAARQIPQATVEAGLARLVLAEGDGAGTALELNIRPLLTAEFEAIDAALDDFVWHLPRGSRAMAVAPALQEALEPRWQAGERLPQAAFERLAYLGAAWQRRLAPKLEPLPQVHWQQSLMAQLGATELAVLRPLLAEADSLEPLLAQLRREHHNPEFWRQRQELPWMEAPPPLEALRRLHLEEGFYAGSHQPLRDLQDWGKDSIRALLDAVICIDDAGSLGLWLAVAQDLIAQGVGPLPPIGQPPAADELLAELGGLEVLYVGDGAGQVQAAHGEGRCFRGQPFGLRVLPMPASRWPGRPGGHFAESLALLLEVVDGLYRQRPFAVVLADCGAYRLPLLRAVHQRYGVTAMSVARPVPGWLISSAA
jgi:hypothetical protein